MAVIARSDSPGGVTVRFDSIICYAPCPLGGAVSSVFTCSVNKQESKTPVDTVYCENVTVSACCVCHEQKKVLHVH